MARVLGQVVSAPRDYAPDILEAIPRSEGRSRLSWDAADNVHGGDVWHLYELSWLDEASAPTSFAGVLTIPCQSHATVESKSLKLYLNSLNFHSFETPQQAVQCITNDLSELTGTKVNLSLMLPSDLAQITREPSGTLVDEFSKPCPEHEAQSDRQALLRVGSDIGSDNLLSNCLRSLCPVTGQPDWATLWIHYRGNSLDPGSVSRYISSFRNHQEYHEQCVERIYGDILAATNSQQLIVAAYYQRRGGVDITPWRSLAPLTVPLDRMGRQ